MRLSLVVIAVAACGGTDARPPDAAPPVIDATPDAGPGACTAYVRPAPVAFPPRTDGFAPLSSVPVPQPVGGDITDFDAAVRLGKLLFWDTQASSDGKVACATCHYTAGVDQRLFNAMNPGPNGTYDGNGVHGPGELALMIDVKGDDRMASEGVQGRSFTAIAADPDDPRDLCTEQSAEPFEGLRQVTPRNSPSVIGAVFLARVFWDGRAEPTFNGVDPFGMTANAGSALVAIEGDPLASQATAPVVNDVEMACTGRPLSGAGSLGAKLLARVPLAHQVVALDDGALGCMSRAPAMGVTCPGVTGACTYRQLFAAAFGDALGEQAEAYFGRLWGQALAAYESTLIPDQTRFDLYLLGDGSAMTTSQVQGMHAVANHKCTNCHAGAEMSDASVTFLANHGPLNVDGGDQGFHNTGVRPTTATASEDLGRATVGPGGASYSISGAAADRGAFKTAMLRDVGLTAPYFYNGEEATLDSLVEFYAHGGDFANTSRQLAQFNFLPGEETAMLDFLRHGLTDCRVATSAAPFDHPSLDVPDGPSLAAVGASGSGSCP